MYLMLLPHVQALCMTALTRTVGHKVAALTAVFSQLSISFLEQTGPEIEWTNRWPCFSSSVDYVFFTTLPHCDHNLPSYSHQHHSFLKCVVCRGRNIYSMLCVIVGLWSTSLVIINIVSFLKLVGLRGHNTYYTLCNVSSTAGWKTEPWLLQTHILHASQQQQSRFPNLKRMEHFNTSWHERLDLFALLWWCSTRADEDCNVVMPNRVFKRWWRQNVVMPNRVVKSWWRQNVDSLGEMLVQAVLQHAVQGGVFLWSDVKAHNVAHLLHTKTDLIKSSTH